MTLSLTKPGGWGVNTKFRSSEATALDANTIKALDKTAAGDTLLGVVTLASGAGFTFASGAAMTLQSGSSLTVASGATAALDLGAGSSLALSNGSSLTAAASGVTVTFNGFVSLLGGGSIAGTFTHAGTLSLTATTTVTDLTCAGTTRIKLNARSRVRVVDSSPISYMLSGGTVASFVCINNLFRQNSVLASSQIRWGIPVRDGSTLTNVSVYVTGIGHSALPTNKPVLVIYSYDRTTGTVTLLGSATDGSASAGALDTRHILSVPLSEVVDASTTSYAAVFFGETGSNTAVIDVSTPHFTATYSAYDET
jgi:hypothetical protein